MHKSCFYENHKKQTTKGPSSVKTNERYSQIPQFEIVRNAFLVLAKDYVLVYNISSGIV